MNAQALRKSAVVTISLASLLFASCVSLNYTVGDRTFSSPSEALAHVDKQLNDMLAAIPPKETPLEATVVVAVPSLDAIKQRGILFRGKMTNDSMKDEMLTYTALSLQKNFEYMGNAIARRGIFHGITQVRVANPETLQSENCDYLVYLQLTSPEVVEWFIKGKGILEPIPLPVRTGVAPGAPRTLAWLEHLESTVKAAMPKP